VTVSPSTEAALRAAMQRLLTGQPERTDGRLTKNNLHTEAGVSRATMNRATSLLTEWDAAVASRTNASAQDIGRDAELAGLQRKLATRTEECARLRQRLEAAATTIGALHHDNDALRGELARHRVSNVIALTPRSTSLAPALDSAVRQPRDHLC